MNYLQKISAIFTLLLICMLSHSAKAGVYDPDKIQDLSLLKNNLSPLNERVENIDSNSTSFRWECEFRLNLKIWYVKGKDFSFPVNIYYTTDDSFPTPTNYNGVITPSLTEKRDISGLLFKRVNLSFDTSISIPISNNYTKIRFHAITCRTWEDNSYHYRTVATGERYVHKVQQLTMSTENLIGSKFFKDNLKIKINGSNRANELRYTTDGTSPVGSADSVHKMVNTNKVTEKSITITNSMTFRCVEYFEDNGRALFSPEVSGSFINLNEEHIKISPTTRQFYSKLELTIEPVSIQPDGIIYTLDNTTPSENNGIQYNKDDIITVTETTILKAVPYFIDNGVTRWGKVISAQLLNVTKPENVTFYPETGFIKEISNTDSLAVSLSCNSPGSTIYYTTDGSEPVAGYPSSQYKEPIILTAPGKHTIKALAALPGRPHSHITTAAFTLFERWTPPRILFTSQQNTSLVQGNTKPELAISTDNATVQIFNDSPAMVFYTINKGMPSPENSIQIPPNSSSAVIPVDKSATIMAVARGAGKEDSRLSIINIKYMDTNIQEPVFKNADLNQNSKIDVGDYTILKSLWGTNGAYNGLSADLAPDGIVNQKDLDIFQSLWWRTATSPAADPIYTSSYMVIDVSAGPEAHSYPVTFHNECPSGNWTDTEYKTDKIVLVHISKILDEEQNHSFVMGSLQSEIGRGQDAAGTCYEDQYHVIIDHSYYIGMFEITQKQWFNVMGTWPSAFFTQSCRQARPVEHVSFMDIRGSSKGVKWPDGHTVDDNSFMGKLRRKTGLTEFDLPTEAEWEFACRGFFHTPFSSFTDTLESPDQRKFQMLNTYARYMDNAKDTTFASLPEQGGTAIVGSFTPNTFGLYDMHGNVAEWCLDLFDYYPRTQLSVTNPSGAESGTFRSIRGGAYTSLPKDCRSAARDSHSQSSSLRSDVGFRLSFWLPF